MVHRALCDMGNVTVANGRLADVLRKVSAFGLILVPSMSGRRVTVSPRSSTASRGTSAWDPTSSGTSGRGGSTVSHSTCRRRRGQRQFALQECQQLANAPPLSAWMPGHLFFIAALPEGPPASLFLIEIRNGSRLHAPTAKKGIVAHAKTATSKRLMTTRAPP